MDKPNLVTRDGQTFTHNAELEKLNPITEKIIGCGFKVSNTLGVGFLEKVYENALAHELRKVGLIVQQQHPVKIWYDGMIIGDYFADLIVENTILIELKSVKEFDAAHYAQCINYLKATGLPLCLLLNFGNSRLIVKRVAL